MRIIKIAAIVVAAIIAIIVVFEMFILKGVTDNVVITAEFTEEGVNIFGTLSESATAYKGYTTEVENDKLYVSIKSGLSILPNRTSDYDFHLMNMENINEVYYKGRTDTYLLVSRFVD